LIRQEGFHYITVSRERPGEILKEGLRVIKQDKNSTVEVKPLDGEGETILYCQSTARAHKEESMKASFPGSYYIHSSRTDLDEKERGNSGKKASSIAGRPSGPGYPPKPG